MSTHGLLVDPVGRQVLDSKTLKPLSKPATAAGTLRSKFAAALCSIAPTVRSLLASFPAIVGDGKLSPKHKIRLTIETTGRPVFAKARRLDPDKLRQAEAEFRELEVAGIIRRSDSPWFSPLHMVRKKDGLWQPCSDYRRLNLATTHHRYPLPSILDLSNKLHGCKFFSCVDLVRGYHQIPMAAQDIAKTAIITPFGLTSSSPATPWRSTTSISGRSSPSNRRTAYRSTQRSAIAEEFLGHQVDQDGVRPLQRHIQAISDSPPPLRM